MERASASSTSGASTSAAFGEITITEWQDAGLLQSSVTKPILATVEKRLVLRKRGQLEDADRKALQNGLGLILG